MLLVWGVAGILTLIGALVTAELASAYPGTGGVYVFLRESYSPAVAFLWCWAMFWSMHTGIIAAIAMVCARYVGFFVPLDDTGIRLVAIAVILVLSAVNYVGVRHGTAVQTAFTVMKVGGGDSDRAGGADGHWRHAGRRCAGSRGCAAGRAVSPRVRRRDRRRTVRVRRLAHGDVHG